MLWQIRGTGLETAPERVAFITSYRSTRFHGLKAFGPLVGIVLECEQDGDAPVYWASADEIILEDDDLEPEQGYWHPADDPSHLTSDRI